MLFDWSMYITTVLSISTVLTQNISNRKPISYGVDTKGLLGKQNDYTLQFERLEMMHFDKKYLKYAKFVTFKYNRTLAVVNASIMFNVDVNDTDILIQAYKFASNEYRLFPMRFQLNFCDAFENNAFGFKDVSKCGNFTGCPFKKDIEIFACNWSPDPARFPPLLPSGQYMIEIQGINKHTEMFFMHGYYTISRKIV